MVTQIYSIISVKEALDCAEAGADHIGVLVSDGSRPCPCTAELETAIEIFKALKGKAVRVLIPATDSEEKVIEFCEKVDPDVVHLSGKFKSSEAFYAKMKKMFPDLRIMQAIGVMGPEALEEARKYQNIADFLLLDTAVPNTTGGIGAIGKVHDWNISRQIVAESRIPVILAGGLGPDNVAESIQFVKPYGVDSLTKTSVKDENGKLLYKDIELVRQFCEIAHNTAV